MSNYQKEQSIPHREHNPEDVISKATGGDTTTTTTKNDSSIFGSAKNLVNKARGSPTSKTTTTAGSGSSEVPQEGYSSKASQGVSNVFSRATGANQGVSGHYLKVTDDNVDGKNTTYTEGNTIGPNDNANVKYSSLVDPVVSDADIEKAKLSAKHSSDKDVSSSSKRSGISTNPLESDTSAGTTRSTSAPLAAQAVGAQNASKDTYGNPTPQGARVDANRSDIPSTKQKHYSEGVGHDYDESASSPNTAKSAAGGGIIGGIIGAVTGRSNSSNTDSSSNYDTTSSKKSSHTTGGDSGVSGTHATGTQAAGTGAVTGAAIGTTSASHHEEKRSGLNAPGANTTNKTSTSSTSGGDYDHSQYSTQDPAAASRTAGSAHDATTGGSGTDYGTSASKYHDNSSAGKTAAEGGLIGGIIGAVTGKGGSSNTSANTSANTTAPLSSSSTARGGSHTQGGFSNEAQHTVNAGEYKPTHSGADTTTTSADHETTSSGTVPGAFPSSAATGAGLGAGAGLAGGYAADKYASGHHSSRDADTYGDNTKAGNTIGNTTGGTTGAASGASGYDRPTTSAADTTAGHNRAGTSAGTTAAGTAAGGGIIGGIIGAVTGRSAAPEATQTRVGEGQYEKEGLGKTDVYSTGNADYNTTTTGGPTPGAAVKKSSSLDKQFDDQNIDSDASVASLRATPGAQSQQQQYNQQSSTTGKGGIAGAAAATAGALGAAGYATNHNKNKGVRTAGADDTGVYHQQPQAYGEGAYAGGVVEGAGPHSTTTSKSHTGRDAALAGGAAGGALGATTAATGSKGFAESSVKEQDAEIHQLDYEIAGIEQQIRQIEAEVDSYRTGSQNKINAKEHEYNSSNYAGGAGLVSEKRAIDTADTAAYGSTEKELGGIRTKQAASSKRLQELEQERKQIVQKSQAIDRNLQSIEASIAAQSKDVEHLSKSNREEFLNADSSRTLKNGPLSSSAVTSKKQLEIQALEDRLARLRLQTQGLDQKITGASSTSHTGDTGKTERGYDDQSLSNKDSSHKGGIAAALAGTAAAVGLGSAASNKQDKQHATNYGGDSSNVGKTERGYDDESRNYESVKSGQGSTLHSNQQPHKFPETLRDTPRQQQQTSSGHHYKEDAALAGATAAAAGGVGYASNKNHNQSQTSRESNIAAAAPHSAQASQKRRSVHEPENSVYPEHETSAKGSKSPYEKLVTGSGAAASSGREPYSYAQGSGDTHSQQQQQTTGEYAGYDSGAVDESADYKNAGAGAALGGGAAAVGAKNFSDKSGNTHSSSGQHPDTSVVAAHETSTSGTGAGSRNAAAGSTAGTTGTQKSPQQQQYDSEKAGSKTQKFLEKIPGLNKKHAAGAGAAVAAGAVAGNAVLGGQSKDSAKQQGYQAAERQQGEPLGVGSGATGTQGTQGTQGTAGAQSQQAGSSTSSGQAFDHKKFGDNAGKGLEGAGVDSKYAGAGGAAAGAGAGYAASKYGQGSSATHGGNTQGGNYQSGQQSGYPQQTSGATGASGTQGTAGAQSQQAGSSTSSGQAFDHKKFGDNAGKGLEGAGVDSKYAGAGGAAAGAGAGYAANKYGQGSSATHGGNTQGAGYQSGQQSGYPQQTSGASQGATQGTSGTTSKNIDANKLGNQAEQYSQKIPGIDKTKAAGIGAAATAGGIAGAAALKNHESKQAQQQQYQHHQDRAGPSGAPHDSHYTDPDSTEKSGVRGVQHHTGPAGAPNDSSYVTGQGGNHAVTSSSDNANNSGKHHYGTTAAAAGTGAGAAYAAESHHHQHHQDRAGPSGAPHDSHYTDPQTTESSGVKGVPHHTGPAGAPNDPSLVTGGETSHQVTAATDSPNNVGRHQASKYPNHNADDNGHTGALGAGAVGGAAVGAAAADRSHGSSGSRDETTGGDESPSIKKKIQNVFKIGGKKDQNKGQLHGTTYDDPNYNSKAYSNRHDTTYNTGDENLGDPQHPNTQSLGGTSGVLGAGILSPEERARYQAAQGEQPTGGYSGSTQQQQQQQQPRTHETNDSSTGAGGYYDPNTSALKSGHGTATKTDPRTGKDVTGSAKGADQLNRETGTGAAAGAGAGLAAGGLAASTHEPQTGYGTQGSTAGGSQQTQHQKGAAVGGTDARGAGGQQQTDDDFIDIKVVGAQDKNEAAAIAAAVLKENRHSKGTFTSNEVVVDADEFKQSHGSNFTSRFSDTDKAVVEQMEHAVGADRGITHH